MPHWLKICLIIYGISAFLTWFYLVLYFSKQGAGTKTKQELKNGEVIGAIFIPVFNTFIGVCGWLIEFPVVKEKGKRSLADVILMRSKKTIENNK